MLAHEKRSAFSIAIIMACRMLGLFMILPVFSLYAGKLPGATPTLIGFALGVYGFTQACLQLPFGSLSDKIGRKQVITLGLILFAIGSLVAALSHSIYGIIIGRALQGGGAVGSTLLALMADLTRDENRAKAMAFVGMSIGFSFSIALVLGPLINAYFHLNGIFWFTFGLALLSVILLYTLVPTPPRIIFDPAVEAKPSTFLTILKDTELLRLDLGIFSMHAILTATFIAIPNLLMHRVGLTAHEQTWLYLVVLLLAFFTMIPLIIIAEKKRQLKRIFLYAIAGIVTAELLFALVHEHAWLMGLWLFLFFTVFSLLEASLPSLVSKISPIHRKGTAMGVYSTAQFLGIFVGGSLGGLLFDHFSFMGVFLFCIILGLIWLIFASRMKEPPYLSTVIIKLLPEQLSISDKIQQHALQQPGVSEALLVKAEELIYIKIDKKIISEDELRNRIKQSNL